MRINELAASFIGIFSIADGDDGKYEDVIVDLVNDAVVAGADPVSVFTFEFDIAGQMGIVRHGGDDLFNREGVYPSRRIIFFFQLKRKVFTLGL